MNISQLTDQFKTFEELKVFCDGQFRQILQLTKKVKELEEKVKNSTVVNNLPSLEVKTFDLSIGGGKILEDAEIISSIQLKRLKELSFERELNIDEAKRVEIYNRILKQPDDKNKPISIDAKVIKNEDLINMVLEDKSGTRS